MRYIIQDKFGFRKRIQFSQNILLRNKFGCRLSRFYLVRIDKILCLLFFSSPSLCLSMTNAIFKKWKRERGMSTEISSSPPSPRILAEPERTVYTFLTSLLLILLSVQQMYAYLVQRWAVRK
jgi:hypothetical protein